MKKRSKSNPANTSEPNESTDKPTDKELDESIDRSINEILNAAATEESHTTDNQTSKQPYIPPHKRPGNSTKPIPYETLKRRDHNQQVNIKILKQLK